MLENLSSFFNNLFLSVASLARVMLQSRWFTERVDKGKEDDLILLGNGPSFAETERKYPQILATRPLMAVNGFCLTDSYTRLKPGYYIINANNFFFQEKDLSPALIGHRDTTFAHLAEKTAWPCVLFVPPVARTYKPFVELMARNPHIRVVYYNNTAVEGFNAFCFPMYACGLGVPRPHNVIIPAIMIAMRMGVKRIALVGADHSWLPEISVTDDNIAMLHQKHFYDENTSKPQAMGDWVVRPRRLHEMLHKFYLSFRGYWDIRDYARHKNVSIYNSSELSFIDAFERKKLDQIFTN